MVIIDDDNGVGLNRRGEETGISLQRLAELTAAATQWRWLLLDELSMVSAELLARLELHCRELARDASRQKYAAGCTTARPFGGLNVILSGDLWQLAPPRGTFLGAIPAQMLRNKGVSTKLPHAAYGQQLIWGGPKNGIQGVTELVTCERTQDEWLREVQEEFRHGKLSASTHAFLHRQPTSVPGSWQSGRAACGDERCAKLQRERADPARIQREECGKCREERRSKALVAMAESDPRFQTDFHEATCIFATNNVKYHVNRKRAQICGREAPETLLRYRRKSRLSRGAGRKAPSGRRQGDLAATPRSRSWRP